jgi:hypothetical protein
MWLLISKFVGRTRHDDKFCVTNLNYALTRRQIGNFCATAEILPATASRYFSSWSAQFGCNEAAPTAMRQSPHSNLLERP